MIDVKRVGQAYAIVAILEAMGGMIGGLAVQGIYSFSLQLGSAWSGQPFWTVAVSLDYLFNILFELTSRQHRSYSTRLRWSGLVFGSETGKDRAKLKENRGHNL